jgi:O-antigen/teichoic acid export membrane protein
VAYQESISLFIIWQIINSFIIVYTLNKKYNFSLKKIIHQEKKFRTIDGFWRLTKLNLILIIINTLYLNIDKFILIKNISPKEFGEYSLCASAVSVLYLIAIPLTQYILPKISILFNNKKNNKKIQIVINYYNNFILNIITSIALTIIIFPEGVIYVWSGDAELVKKIAPIFSLLILGTYFNAITYFPCQILIAANKIKYNINIISIIMLMYLLIINIKADLTTEFVAKVYLFMNILYFVIISYEVKKIYKNSYENIIKFIKIIITNGIILLIEYNNRLESYGENRIQWVVFLSFSIIISLFVSLYIFKRKNKLIG